MAGIVAGSAEADGLRCLAAAALAAPAMLPDKLRCESVGTERGKLYSEYRAGLASGCWALEDPLGFAAALAVAAPTVTAPAPTAPALIPLALIPPGPGADDAVDEELVRAPRGTPDVTAGIDPADGRPMCAGCAGNG